MQRCRPSIVHVLVPPLLLVLAACSEQGLTVNEPVITGDTADLTPYVGIYASTPSSREDTLYFRIWPAHPDDGTHLFSYLLNAEDQWKFVEQRVAIKANEQADDSLLVQLQFPAFYWLERVERDGDAVLWGKLVDDNDELKRLQRRFGIVGEDGEYANPLDPQAVARYLAAAKARKPAVRFDRLAPGDGRWDRFLERRNLALDRFRYQLDGEVRKAQAAGKPPSASEAVRLVEAMHEYADPWATYMMARFFTTGSFVEKDIAKARALAQDALAQGYRRAERLLGYMAAEGIGQPADKTAARRHFQRAADAGSAAAHTNLAMLDLTSDDRAARYRAVSHLQTAAAAGEPHAANHLGRMYLQGELVAKDEAEARRLFEVAEPYAFVDAAFYLGLLRSTGRGGPVDGKGAVKAYEQAAALGSSPARFNLGMILAEGKLVEEDDEKAVKLFGEAAAAGHLGSMGSLAYAYESGQGIAKDEGKAVAWYRRCAARERPYCQWRLGVMTADGRGTARDTGRARVLLEQAAAGGEDRAKTSLAALDDAAAPAQPPSRRTAGTQAVGAAALKKTAALTTRVADLVLKSPWARDEDGKKAISIEFYSQAGFHFSVAPDRSECFFHFWRTGNTPEMLNRALDTHCDGVVEIFQLFEDDAKDHRRGPLPPYQHAFYDYYLRRYAELFEAVNGFRSYLPEARLALLPDLKTIEENGRLLRTIATAAATSQLRGVPRNEEDRQAIHGPVLKIWINHGEGPKGVVLYFSADRAGGGRLRDCFVSVEDSRGAENMIDENCDAIPEGWKDNRGSRAVHAAGNEKVVQSLLLEIARFAEVANTWFREEDIGPVARAAAALQQQ